MILRGVWGNAPRLAAYEVFGEIVPIERSGARQVARPDQGSLSWNDLNVATYSMSFAAIRADIDRACRLQTTTFPLNRSEASLISVLNKYWSDETAGRDLQAAMSRAQGKFEFCHQVSNRSRSLLKL